MLERRSPRVARRRKTAGTPAALPQPMSQDLWNRSLPHPAGYREAGPPEVAAARASARLIDVREAFEVAAGHVPGSELVPLGQIAQAAAAWSKDELYVLVCRSGARSGRAAEYLTSLGFSRVINMVGGMLAYEGLGLEIARDA